MMREFKFKYDEGQSEEINFERWYNMNCREKADYNEKLYTKEEGKRVFKQYINNDN